MKMNWSDIRGLGILQGSRAEGKRLKEDLRVMREQLKKTKMSKEDDDAKQRCDMVGPADAKPHVLKVASHMCAWAGSFGI